MANNLNAPLPSGYEMALTLEEYTQISRDIKAPVSPTQLTTEVSTSSKSRRSPENWRESANCRDSDPDMFFPSEVSGVNAAKAICAACVSIDSCLDYALDNNILHGVWGGTSERQRRKIHRQLRIAAPTKL